MSTRVRWIVLGVVVVPAFLSGYFVGLGDQATVPDLYGLDGAPNDLQVYVTLKRADLRIGRARLTICGGKETRGIVVNQFPAAGASVPVDSVVNFWTAVPESELTIDFDPGIDHPCQRPVEQT